MRPIRRPIRSPKRLTACLAAVVAALPLAGCQKPTARAKPPPPTAGAIVQSRRPFLLRMSSKVHLYTLGQKPLESWSEGRAYYWPEYAQKAGQPPVIGRLLRVPAQGQAKRDIWLLTDVLETTRLPVSTAAKFYRWRWRNEGVFRIYKRTLNKGKLCSRTVRLVHREAEVSLLAVQILLAYADVALRSQSDVGHPAISPRKVLLAIRQEIQGSSGRRVQPSKLTNTRA
jgi:hypothetical protein